MLLDCPPITLQNTILLCAYVTLQQQTHGVIACLLRGNNTCHARIVSYSRRASLSVYVHTFVCACVCVRVCVFISVCLCVSVAACMFFCVSMYIRTSSIDTDSVTRDD